MNTIEKQLTRHPFAIARSPARSSARAAARCKAVAMRAVTVGAGFVQRLSPPLIAMQVGTDALDVFMFTDLRALEAIFLLLRLWTASVP